MSPAPGAGKSRIAIIAAMPGELKPFLDSQAKEGWIHERSGSVHVWRLIWPLDQIEWVAACAGAGQDAASRAFAAAEAAGPLSSVISVGWAGALSDACATGRAYAASGVIDARTGERYRPALWSEERWLVTSPIVANEAEKQRLSATYSAALVDMEAAAIARLAGQRGIPFYCFKAVSDGFTDKLPDFNRFISASGQFQTAGFVLFALLRPWLWPRLVRMGENSRKAAAALAACLLDFLDERAYIRNRNGHPDSRR